jgi:endonuclease/exonuclease/phosphatase family metal-dependent hydrolase
VVRARLRLVLGGLLLIVGLAAVATPTPTVSTGSTGSTTGDLRLFQFNMCGRVCPWPAQVKTAAVVDSLDEFHPAAVSLNEVCRSQFTGIVSGIASRRWTMSAVFLVTRTGACSDGTDFGNAVLTRAKIGSVDRTIYAAQGPDHGEFRGLLCVIADLGLRPTRICSTHIVNSGPDPTGSIRRSQIAQAASLVGRGASRMPVVLMGDFNLPPGDVALDRLYTRAHPGGIGAFDEVDQGTGKCRCGEVTQRSGEKIDYVFVTARDFNVVTSKATRADFSDHASLRGWVTVK